MNKQNIPNITLIYLKSCLDIIWNSGEEKIIKKTKFNIVKL